MNYCFYPCFSLKKIENSFSLQKKILEKIQKFPKEIFVLKLKPKFQVTDSKSKLDRVPHIQNTFWHTDILTGGLAQQVNAKSATRLYLN